MKTKRNASEIEDCTLPPFPLLPPIGSKILVLVSDYTNSNDRHNSRKEQMNTFLAADMETNYDESLRFIPYFPYHFTEPNNYERLVYVEVVGVHWLAPVNEVRYDYKGIHTHGTYDRYARLVLRYLNVSDRQPKTEIPIHYFQCGHLRWNHAGKNRVVSMKTKNQMYKKYARLQK